MRQARVGKIRIGQGAGIVLIAGPCVIESESHCMKMAEKLKKLIRKMKVPFIFKSSYDKANRLSGGSFRGPGLERGLRILEKVKESFELPVLSDVHSVQEIAPASEVLDVIQIPALLCRQTDLVVAAARTGKPVNLKKGQFMAPWDIPQIAKKIEEAGNSNIFITERGYSFGYNNLVTDFRALQIIRGSGYPVIYDATHSVQLPGGKGGCSGGQRQFVPALCRAAVAFGCDGLFLEVHDHPDSGLCDGPNMVDLATLEGILEEAKKIEAAL